MSRPQLMPGRLCCRVWTVRQGVGHGLAHADDLALALRLADAADAVTLPRFRAADLRVTTQARPQPRHRRRHRRRGGAARGDRRRAAGRRGARRGGRRRGDRRRTACWVLDPIDGTKNFSRGMPAWATLIALTVDGTATVGVVSAPALGRRWWGAVGAGRVDVGRAGRAAAADRGLRGRRRSATPTCPRLTCASSGSRRRDRWLALVDAVWETRAFGDFWQHVLVAEGVLDVAVDPVANPWDLAALAPVVAEAGGRLTDLAGVDDLGGRRRAHHQRRAARRGPRRDRPVGRPGPGSDRGNDATRSGTVFRHAHRARRSPRAGRSVCSPPGPTTRRESLSASRKAAGVPVGPPRTRQPSGANDATRSGTVFRHAHRARRSPRAGRSVCSPPGPTTHAVSPSPPHGRSPEIGPPRASAAFGATSATPARDGSRARTTCAPAARQRGISE